MEELIFSKLQKGDTLYTLERDRRSMYPIFDKATVIRVGEIKPISSGNDGNFVSSIEVVIQDSVSSLTIFLPVQTTEGIHNGVYYTTDLKNIVNEVNVQRTNALNVLNNRDKYETIVTECDNIFKTIEGMIAPQAPAQAYKPEELETFKMEIDTRLSTQENLLLQIAQELGLNNKEKKDGKKG